MADATKKTPVQELAELEEAHQNAMAEIRLAAARSGSQGYVLKLIEPIMVGPAKWTELRFRPQTVADIRNTSDQDTFAASLCNLMPEQIKQLCYDDWEAVQEVIAGFARRRAAGGPARSTKTT